MSTPSIEDKKRKLAVEFEAMDEETKKKRFYLHGFPRKTIPDSIITQEYIDRCDETIMNLHENTLLIESQLEFVNELILDDSWDNKWVNNKELEGFKRTLRFTMYMMNTLYHDHGCFSIKRDEKDWSGQ